MGTDFQQEMNVTEIFQIAGAVVISLGGGAALVFALSSWLGKVWATRILAADKLKYEQEMEAVRAKFNLSLKEYEIKTSAIQEERKKMILAISPPLTKAYYLTSVYCDLAAVGAPREDTRELKNDCSLAIHELYERVAESKLFLTKELFDKVQEFHRVIAQAWTHSSYTERIHGNTSPPELEKLSKAMKTEQENIRAAEKHIDEIMQSFREILGTSR